LTQAIIFGGGIGEDTPFVREQVLKRFEWFGLRFDVESNQQIINREGRITTADSSVSAYVIPVEERLMIADRIKRLSSTIINAVRMAWYSLNIVVPNAGNRLYVKVCMVDERGWRISTPQ
jgi:hypothetical protein